MAISNTKIVQSYIQLLIKAVELIENADILVQEGKTKFIAKNPDLSGTNITQAQITAVNNFINDLNVLVTSQTATVLKSKNVPSHDTKLLD